MIVLNTFIDEDELASSMKSAKELLSYVNSLVPELYKHNLILISNQRYFMYQYILTNMEVDRRQRSIINELVKGIRIAGSISEFIPICEVEQCVDKHKVNKYFIEEGNGIRYVN